jgi:hypothetical protein
MGKGKKATRKRLRAYNPGQKKEGVFAMDADAVRKLTPEELDKVTPEEWEQIREARCRKILASGHSLDGIQPTWFGYLLRVLHIPARQFPFRWQYRRVPFPWPQHWGPKPELPEGLSENAILDALWNS